MKKLFSLALIIGLALAAHVEAKVIVGASLPDLGSIAAAIGGERIEIFAISRASADPHNVEVLPSYMVRVSRADLYLKVGLSLDQWADGIIDVITPWALLIYVIASPDFSSVLHC